jgi:hypothetical protein
MEADNFGEQSMAYKVLKHLNRTNKDTIEINNTEDQKWIEHYKSLWCSNSPQNNNDEPKQSQLYWQKEKKSPMRNMNRALNQ